MYRFNDANSLNDVLQISFKYNPCIGSIISKGITDGFQTSFKYNPCIGSIAGHYASAETVFKFKYNPCIGSIGTSNLDKERQRYLNTTHVSVQC